MSQTSMSLFDTSTQTQRDMIAQLEARNNAIMNEIARLKYEMIDNKSYLRHMKANSRYICGVTNPQIFFPFN